MREKKKKEKESNTKKKKYKRKESYSSKSTFLLKNECYIHIYYACLLYINV